MELREALKYTVISVGSGGLGFMIGYKLLEKRLSDAFDERLETETAGMKEFYQAVKQPYSSPEEAVAKLVLPEVAKDPRVKNNATQYHKVPAAENLEEFKPAPVQKPTPIVQNVFEDRGPEVISQEVFMANDPEHTQATLTYYEDGGQLCGEADEPIDNEEIVVGVSYKSKFGWESSDENVVHVRNDGLKMDFEIVRSAGSYEAEVLGQTDTDLPPHKRVGR